MVEGVDLNVNSVTVITNNQTVQERYNVVYKKAYTENQLYTSIDKNFNL